MELDCSNCIDKKGYALCAQTHRRHTLLCTNWGNAKVDHLQCTCTFVSHGQDSADNASIRGEQPTTLCTSCHCHGRQGQTIEAICYIYKVDSKGKPYYRMFSLLVSYTPNFVVSTIQPWSRCPESCQLHSSNVKPEELG